MSPLRPQNAAERIVWAGQAWTWPLYALGALYVAGPVLGWVLGALAALALFLGPAIRPDLGRRRPWSGPGGRGCWLCWWRSGPGI